MSKWIEFIQMADTRKTRVWDVVTKDGGIVLGVEFMDAEMTARKV